MTSFWRIFWLEWTSLVRSRTLAMLLVAAVAWMLLAPRIFVGDGTAEGAREVALHFSLGGVAALLAVTLLASAAGSISADRASKRLALTLVRPVRAWQVALGRMAALVACGAVVLFAAAAVELARQDPSRPCRSVLRPVLPSPRAEAEEMYRAYMADPATPQAVRRAKKGAVIRMLEQRALDHYQTVGTNSAVRLPFPDPRYDGARGNPSVRFRFSNTFAMRDEVCGVAAFGGWSGTVSNITQAVIEVPLARRSGRAASAASAGGLADFEFVNSGAKPVMLRPRKDVELLVPADGFGWNLLRATLELLAVLSMLVSFGVFLGAGLGRPAALFVAIAALALSEMSPSVVQQYPDELETNRLDAIGLHLTRFAAQATHPVSALSPMSALSRDECVERRELVRAAALGFVAFPLVFALLAAAAMPRKQEGEQ